MVKMEEVDHKISVAILAGGLNTRFGGFSKARIRIEGSEIIDRTINEISSIADEVIVVTNSPGDFRHLTGVMIVGDIFLKAGPLGGIHSAMKIARGDSLFVVASDMPFIDKEIVREEIKAFRSLDCEALVPVVDEKIEPLHAVYSLALASRLEEFLSGNEKRAIRDFLRTVNVNYWTPGVSDSFKRSAVNINTPEELEKVKNMYLDKFNTHP